MKGRAIFLFSALVASVLAGQDSIKLERSYRENEVDSYKVGLTVLVPDVGSIVVDFNLTQTVKRVHANGDADIESKPSNMVLKANGQVIPREAIGGGDSDGSSTTRFDKFFRAVTVPGTAPAQGLINQFSFMRYGAMLTGQPMKVGETIPVSFESKETKTTISGTAKLVSLVNGRARIESSLKVKSPETGKSASDLKLSSEIDVATSKPIRVDGTVTNLPSPDGMRIDRIQFTMEKPV